MSENNTFNAYLESLAQKAQNERQRVNDLPHKEPSDTPFQAPEAQNHNNPFDVLPQEKPFTETQQNEIRESFAIPVFKQILLEQRRAQENADILAALILDGAVDPNDVEKTKNMRAAYASVDRYAKVIRHAQDTGAITQKEVDEWNSEIDSRMEAEHKAMEDVDKIISKVLLIVDRVGTSSEDGKAELYSARMRIEEIAKRIGTSWEALLLRVPSGAELLEKINTSQTRQPNYQRF